MFYEKDGKLVFHYDAEEVWIEPWGDNSLRIRATQEPQMRAENWALEEPEKRACDIQIENGFATIANGKLICHMSADGRIELYHRDGRLLVKEYWRNRRVVTADNCSALEIAGREWKGQRGGNYQFTLRLESLDENEKLYGMGQYQQPYLNLKGTDLELAHRNSQASVPFFLSSLGYGMLWNQPGVGRAVFGKNIMTFAAYATSQMDVWVTAGDTPAEIEEAYAGATGKAPMMPEYGLGFWQCKLRYQTQEEVLRVAREYVRRKLPLDVIVIDYFHWKYQGEWKFDPEYWPDPEAMIAELEELGVKLMVSIWPTVEEASENYQEMLERGYLIRTERGIRVGLRCEGDTIHVDVTNPAAREYLWKKAEENYYKKGIHIFWLDEAEPEYSVYDFDNYRYYLGTNLEIGNSYPVCYARTFYEGMKRAGQEQVVNLLRCAWAGSQKYGALVWSGDIASSFESMRNQLAAGLSMGIAGIPWWTTDIGGFHGGNPDDPAFRELFARWFAWAAFCPVMRLHGDREPHKPPMGERGGAHCPSGADNEVWSYGEEVYRVCEKYLRIREEMRDYTRHTMLQAAEHGTPVMRTMFYAFPEDTQCWEIEDAYMYGDRYLVAPVLSAGATERTVYLPKGAQWREKETGCVYTGGQWRTVCAPLDVLPVFEKI